MKTWGIVDDKLTKDYDFNDFDEAISFVNMVADVAEEHNHHPDILLHSYKKVRLMLKTHTAAAVTQKDYDLAQAIDDIGKKRKERR